ncbi:MAG: BadF/BadG/BcrA/BcrD ATPase family protein [Bacteroidota bacterium]
MTAPARIGIDAGGTKTALHGQIGDRTVRLNAPGVHLLRDGTETSAETLAALAREALDGTATGSVCVGVAGAGREDDRIALRDALSSRLDGLALRVVHDAEIALHAAWDDTSGVVLIAGTGSVLFARDEEGEIARAGGWGWRVGDDGSGVALGRAALRIALAAHDGGPPSTLVEKLAEQDLGTPESIRQAIYTHDRPLGSFARALIESAEASDWQAEQAVMRETNALAQQAGWLATRLGDTVSPRLAMTGGLLQSEAYQQRLRLALERHLPGWSIETSERAPVEGALAMAEALIGS